MSEQALARPKEPSPTPPIVACKQDEDSLGKTARGFFIFAIVAVLALAPHFLSQDQSWNFLSYIAAAFALGGLTVMRRAKRGASASFSSRIRAALSAEQWATFAVFVAFLALYSVTMFDPSPYNEQVRQAVAFVHGHVHIEAPDSFLEHAQVGPFSYSLHPPLAPILLMPFAAIWGMDTNQTEFSVLLGAIDLALAWLLLGRFDLSDEKVSGSRKSRDRKRFVVRGGHRQHVGAADGGGGNVFARAADGVVRIGTSALAGYLGRSGVPCALRHRPSRCR